MQDHNAAIAEAHAAQRWEPRPVDEVIPLWKREPGRRGPLNKDEKAAKAANADARAEYERMREELIVARTSADHWRSEAEEKSGQLDQAIAQMEGWERDCLQNDAERRQDQQAAPVFATVVAQLAQDTKLEIRQVSVDPATSQQRPQMHLMLGSNNDFSVVLTGNADGTIQVAIERGRIMSFIVGTEGLDENQRDAVRGYFAKKKLPSAAAAEQATASTRTGRHNLANRLDSLITLLSAFNCGSESCPIHGKGGLIQELRMLKHYLNAGYAAMFGSQGEYGMTEPSQGFSMGSFHRYGGLHAEKARPESSWDFRNDII